MSNSRDNLIFVIEESRYWVRRMSDGYLSSGENRSDAIADAILSKFNVTDQVK